MFRRYGTTNKHDDDEHDSKLDVARCDHYSYDEDEAITAATPLNKKRKNIGSTNKSSLSGSKLLLLLLLPLILLSLSSLLYSYKLQSQLSSLTTSVDALHRNASSLQSTLSAQSIALTALNSTIQNHSAVISRFSDSVSNTDVLQKLSALQSEWNASTARIEREMETTEAEINRVLDSTKRSIDETVTSARDEIRSQVSAVQSDLSRYIRTTQDQFSTENSFMVYQLAGTFTLLGCLISMWHMTSHLRSFRQPFVQRKILAILWMCPIYSVTSWLSLVIPSIEGYLAILKDLYEAYVIYTFLSFCIAVLGKGDRDAVVDLLAGHADHLSPPIRCFGWCRKELRYMRGEEGNSDENRRLADDVLLQCQIFAMQFVFLRPLLTAILFTLKKMDYHGPMFGPGSPFDNDYVDGEAELEVGGGMVDYKSPQFYLVILENVSVFMAFSGLLKFYHAVQEDLSWCRPFPKFLCIKGVVFMTFWQGVVISLLADTTDLLSSNSSEGNDEQEEIMAKQTQNFLICLEMLGFSIAHFYCFPVEEWDEDYRPKQNESKFGDNMALGDFLHDLKLILRHNKNKRKKTNKLSSEDDISTVLEEDEELGDGESSDNGLDSLLQDVEGLLESREKSGNTSTKQQRKSSLSRRAAPSPSGIFGSLREMNAPKELYDATALLLQSSLLDEATARLLAKDIMELSAADEHSDPGNSNGGEVPNEALDQSVNDEEGVAEVANDQSNNVSDGSCENEQEDPKQTDHDEERSLQTEERVPDETSALLQTTIQNEEMLKPSIFTMPMPPAKN